MERTYICDGNKYRISPTNTITLPVTLENLPNEALVGGHKLPVSPSFHVSLVCINEIIRKNNIADPNFRDLVLKDFCDFVNVNDIDLLNYKNEYKYCEKNELKSIVVMCSVSNLDKFFEIINKKYGLNLENPPTHVTIYKLTLGIFLTDSSDIQKFSKPISNPVGRNL